MSVIQTHDRLQLPGSLQTQLHDFRRRVWSIKMFEAVCGTVFGVVVPFLALFAFDRLLDSPVWLRGTLFVLAVAGCATVPLALHRWVWRNRRLEQLARLLSRKHPHVGDQLLGVIELVENDAEQARSRTLCEAAIEQVAHDAQKRDFRDAVPNPRHRLWSGLAAVPAMVALGLAVLCPAAAANAWSRLLSPWQDIPRFTFAAFEQLPERLVVAHGEPFTFTARLASGSLSHPSQGTVQISAQLPVTAALRDGRYEFELPSQIESGWLDVRVGDFRQTLNVDPKLRPELTSIAAEFNLPDYLGLPEKQTKDVRGGVLTLVNGSRVALTATASRNIANGTVDGVSRTPREASLTSPEFVVDGARRVEFQWTDEFGLAGKEPFVLTMTGRDDEAPSLIVEDLPRHKVVIESEVLSFKIRARDDFGVKAVGIEWKGVENPVVKSPAEGERLLAAGGNDKESLDLAGTFSAKSLGIEPQPVNVRVYVEDFLPGRARVYSSPHTFYVMTAEQHAIWITEQMSKWHRQALEVRDRELQLYETNKQLRELAQDELDRPETRRRVENQANAERANGRRLSNLTSNGEELVRQAMRNPEIGVGHLEKWAEMLQILKDISSNRMPSVADLLKAASQAPAVADSQPTQKNPMAGQVRASGEGKGTKSADKPPEPKPPVPEIVDAESSQQPKAKKTGEEEPPPPASKKPALLRLPVTTVMGDGSGKKKPAATPAEEKVDEAIKEQQDLLAEFEKIADELNRVLANLEGSTLVKRLKAASRVQYKIGGRIGDQLKDTFGVAPARVPEKPLKVIGEMSEQEGKASLDVSFIMDDMQSYYERRHFVKFKTVLDDMRQLDVIGSLRQLGDDLRGDGQHNENGMSLAQTEYWSDTLDRWAEDLVDPACCGACTGCKAKGSLPPSIVLEVLQILEGEINLRDETRVAEQARPAIPADEHKLQGMKLSVAQADLRVRIDKVIDRIRELPDGESDFAKEIKLLGMVSFVMNEATEILARPETGNPAIAAETEAIELLLQSKRINPKGGGGGGSSPGGGGGGTTQDSALSLIGTGANDKEVREDRGISQATGNTGPALPEEFRAGLDEYFNRLDRGPSRE
jgi:hypothetical protein